MQARDSRANMLCSYSVLKVPREARFFHHRQHQAAQTFREEAYPHLAILEHHQLEGDQRIGSPSVQLLATYSG